MKFFQTGIDQSKPGAPSPQEAYYGIRKLALHSKPEDLRLNVAPGEPYGVLMEMGIGGSTATFVAFRDGTMSMYTQGQTVLGTGGHLPVREAGFALIDASRDYLHLMKKAVDFPLPEQGMLKFYVLTPEATLTYDAHSRDLGTDPITLLFNKANDLVTQIRLASTASK
jgi:hypothetical protein